MKSFPKILFPVDYSDASAKAVPYVRDMVRRNQAELTVFHSLPLISLPVATGDFLGAVPMAPATPEIRAVEKERLAFFTAKHFSDLHTRQVLADGEAAPSLEEEVAQHGIDLVMMPTHGAGAIRRLLLGSVAAKILHDLNCAVWTFVPGHTKDFNEAAGFRSIVCALTGHIEEDAVIARKAGEFAREHQSRLTLVHVVEPPPVTWEFDFESYRDKLMGDAEARLLKLDSELGLEAGVRIVCDMIPRGIHDVCTEEEASLLIVGRGHARDGLGRIWSQLYSTIREAPCPVLSV
jgi:nucleotide-binding universal stress UspA family protein